MALKKISTIIEEAGLKTGKTPGAAEALVKYLIKQTQNEVIHISPNPIPTEGPSQLSFQFTDETAIDTSKQTTGPKSA